jgi:DNA-binding CsgD family transcriptional regulator
VTFEPSNASGHTAPARAFIEVTSDLKVLSMRGEIPVNSTRVGLELIDGRLTLLDKEDELFLETAVSSGSRCYLLLSDKIVDGQILSLRATPLLAPNRSDLGSMIEVCDPQGEVPYPMFRIAGYKDLTPAERKVWSLMMIDPDAAKVAKILKISPETAKTHRKRLYAKLGVSGYFELHQLGVRFFLA